jgi:hypothetical protein
MRDHGRTAWLRGAALALVFGLAASLSATAKPQAAEVRFLETPGRVEIFVGDEPVATYVYEDPEISRPYFAHVRAPGGTQVSRNHPPVPGKDRMDHPTFHPGIWLTFGEISGNDYWRLKARTEQSEFVEEPQVTDGVGAFAVRNRYLEADDPQHVVCEEVCRFTISERPAGYLLTWDSTFTSDREFYFGDQEEMGLGIRVATPLRAEVADATLPPPTGTMTDSEGRRNGAQIGGNTADWCDYSGTLDDRHVGMTVFCHPDNFRPSWFHARDYGFLAANAFGRAAFKKGEPSKVVVKPGEELRLRYGILIHACDAGSTPDLPAAYQNYLTTVREAR